MENIAQQQQQEIKDWLAYAGKSQTWLSEQLDMTRQTLSTKLNYNKREDYKFFVDSIDVIKKELDKQGKKYPDWYSEDPEPDNIEANKLINALDYMAKRVAKLEEENEKLLKENQVLRVQFSQIEDAGKRLKQGNR